MCSDRFETTATLVAERASYVVLKASGENILGYLQGQLTQDANRLKKDKAIYSALLTPQAKAVSDLYLLSGNHGEVVMLVPAKQAAVVVERLKRFALGYTLRIGKVSSMHIVSVQGGDVQATLTAHGLPIPGQTALAVSSSGEILAMRMPESASDGVWLVGEQLDIPCSATEAELDRGRILQGHPLFGVDWDESMHPLNANLIERDGVSFEKGCYVGQEVTSRMHWKGGIKKKIYRVRLEGEVSALPCAVLTSVKIGEITSMVVTDDGQQLGIATLPIEVVVSGAELSLPDGGKVTVLGACGS